MRRRFALKAIAAGVVSLVGCQCIVQKEVPEVKLWKKPPIEMYWDDVNKRWISFEKIELSKGCGQFCCCNGIVFELRGNTCIVSRGDWKMSMPLTKNKYVPKLPKHKFVEHVSSDRSIPKNGLYYEVINKDFGTDNLLYI